MATTRVSFVGRLSRNKSRLLKVDPLRAAEAQFLVDRVCTSSHHRNLTTCPATLTNGAKGKNSGPRHEHERSGSGAGSWGRPQI